MAQAVAGVQGSAGAGLPPGQYVPGRHCVALKALMLPSAQPAPGAALQLPLQAGEARPAALPYTPAGQGLHDVDPFAAAKVPTGHGMQLLASEVAEYDPGAHCVQVELTKVPVEPGGQAQAIFRTL